MGFQFKNDCIKSNMTQKWVPEPANTENSCVFGIWIQQGSDNAMLINFAADGLGSTLHRTCTQKGVKKHNLSNGHCDKISVNVQLNPRFTKFRRTPVLICIDKDPQLVHTENGLRFAIAQHRCTVTPIRRYADRCVNGAL